MAYKRGDRVVVRNIWDEEIETTILSQRKDGAGYAVIPPLGEEHWYMSPSRLSYYPDALLGDRCWFYFSESIVGFATEVVVIAIID